MKKFWTLLFLIFLSANLGFAEDDLWDNFGDTNIYGQQSVSEKEFDKAVESKQKKSKKRDKNLPKGENFSQSAETEVITNTKNELQILMVPLNLKAENSVPVGHYLVEGVKESDGKVYLKFYQSHDLIAKLPAVETDDDFDEPSINFVKLRPHGDYHVEVIYGCLDFNAYTIIDIE